MLSDARLGDLLPHQPQVVLGVLVEVLSLDNITAPRRVLRHSGKSLVIVASISGHVPRIAVRADARRAMVR